ncbi:right-handed parallel beta-helix repeat-containing protein [Corallococcus terminator]|uniref:Right-handed parallel beta-helix repeat-containing protein n=1 Tax=Corallococcus terminator TaxID=2316733 RepID=A0A3A8JAG1_9BACT|nr:right-handed parallel beta-helix repeat-containing protein [Corallococcus terminator]RKG92682.1 right-handed parallel beta-helix repeat-containing protein [Corallococcus terminator]
MRRIHAVHLAGALLLTTFGCVQEEPSFDVAPSGGARLVVALPRSLVATSVAEVTSTATNGSGKEASSSLALEDNANANLWVGEMGPVTVAGETVGLRVDARDATGAVVATVSVPTVALPPYGDALVVAVPQPEAAPGEAGGNTAPRIDAVVASVFRGVPGDRVELRAWAHDLDAGEVLAYAWSAPGDSLECPEDPTQPTCTWTVPENPERKTDVVLGLSVSDPRGGVSSLSFRFALGEVGAVASNKDIQFNRAPFLEAAVDTQQVGVGLPIAMEAKATDEDGDALTYTWSATCTGSFEGGNTSSVIFTPTEDPAECGCQVEARVEDAFTGADTAIVAKLCVRRSEPPVIGPPTQSAPSARAGERVTFTVTATDPRSEPLTFTWKTSAGAVGTAVGDGTTSTVDWTELSCVPTDVAPTVEVTVTNASGSSARHTFTVEWTDRRCGALAGACAFTMAQTQVTLSADCVTQGPVFIPDGFTFDGAAHTVTAVEDVDAGEHFQGAVLRNRGPVASVRNVTVTARNLSDVCDAGAARLRGIFLEGASGVVVDTVVTDLHQKGNLSGCQEGVAIEVRNDVVGATPVKVDVLRNRVTGYQKGGVVVVGQVVATVEANILEGGGLVDHIARNGLQLAYGVSGRVEGNQVTGHAYTGEDTGSGILVVGGSYYGAGRALCHDLFIQGNELTGNDVGVNLAQAEGAEFSAPSEPTRIQVLENVLSNDALTNGYVYQAAISDSGTGNLISLNRISGDGYDPVAHPDEAFSVDVVTVSGEREVAFATPARSVEGGTCSEALVVQGRDVADNLASLVDPTVELTASEGGTAFHLQPDCSDASVASVELAGAQREAVFYVRAGAAGVVTVTATGDGVSVTQDLTVR